MIVIVISKIRNYFNPTRNAAEQYLEQIRISTQAPTAFTPQIKTAFDNILLRICADVDLFCAKYSTKQKNQTAETSSFNIGHFTGVLGNVTDSRVTAQSVLHKPKEEKKPSLAERPFKWIDRFESESTRRIIQNLITYFLWAIIVGTGLWIWAKRDWFASQSKSFWNILQYPIQLKLWIILIAAFAITWRLFLRRQKQAIKAEGRANDGQQSLLLKQNEALLAQLNELNEKIMLNTQDPKFLEILNYVIDDNRAKGFRYIVERCIGSVEKAVPLVEQSDTFDEFMENAGLKLDVPDKIKTPLEYPNMNGHQQFGVASLNNPLGTDMANFTIEGNHTVHMNPAAHMHFDWSFLTFKKQYDTKFQTPKGVALLHESSKAAAALHEKYIDVLNSYPDCVFPLLGIDDTEEKYKSRIETFQTALGKLSREMQSKEVFIVRKDKLKNLHKYLGLIWHCVNANQHYHINVNSYANRQPAPEGIASAKRIDEDITETENEINRLEPLVKKDFEYLVAGK